MAKMPYQNCPVSKNTPPAQIDKNGWCSEHQWACENFEAFSDDFEWSGSTPEQEQQPQADEEPQAAAA